MKKIVFAVIIAAVAASPAMAAKKKSAKKPAAAPVMATTPANSNENSVRFVRGAFPIFLPSWAVGVYVANQPK